MRRELSRWQDAVNERLKTCVESCAEVCAETRATSGGAGYATLIEAMNYSLLSGGKRIRAVLCVKFCEAARGNPEDALDAACAIEMMHTYSLIHDDLPCMDDDDIRRGRPSNHIRYGESTATLAGDALQAAAFETLLGSKLPPGNVVRMARALARAAGPQGICAGQYLDLSGTGKRPAMDALLELNALKTAALIAASARIGVIAAGGTREQETAAERYARSVGLAFQARDDILDITAAQVEFGKPIGSDRDNDKTTLAALLGVDGCNELIGAETEKAIAALGGKFAAPEFLVWLARMLAERNS